jgi:hypothetical protein
MTNSAKQKMTLLSHSGSWSQLDSRGQSASWLRKMESLDALDLRSLSVSLEILAKKNEFWANLEKSSIVHECSDDPNEKLPRILSLCSDDEDSTDIKCLAEKICEEMELSPTCLVMAAIYFDRVHTNLSQTFGCTFLLKTSNARRLLVVATRVASIVFGPGQGAEVRLRTSAWANLAGVTPEEFEALERTFVFDGLSASLDVSIEEFELKEAVLGQLATLQDAADSVSIEYLPALDESHRPRPPPPAAAAADSHAAPAAPRSVFSDLRSSPLAAQVEDGILLQMVSCARVRRFLPGVKVVSAGWEGHSMYMVHKGRLAIRVNGAHKRHVEEGQVLARIPARAGQRVCGGVRVRRVVVVVRLRATGRWRLDRATDVSAMTIL